MELSADRRLSRRCTLVTAAAGFGKTTAVRDRLRGVAVRWHDASLLTRSEAVPVATTEPLWLVADEVERVDPAGAVAFAESLPAQCRLVVVGRTPAAGGLARWRARGLLAELGPEELALSRPQVEALLQHEYGARDGHPVWRWTGGWPALVHLTGQAMTRPDRPGSERALLNWLTAPDTALADFLGAEVLDSLSPAEMALLTDAAELDPLTVDLAVELGHEATTVDALRRAGLLRVAGEPGHFRVVPLLATFLRPRRRRDVLGRAAGWYAGHDLPLAAVRALRSVGRTDEAVELLASRGESVLAVGGAATVIQATEELPPARRPEPLRLLHAQALYTTGESAAALRMLTEQRAERSGPVDPALAWRLGSLHYLSGDPRAALEVFRHAAVPDPDDDPAGSVAGTGPASDADPSGTDPSGTDPSGTDPAAGGRVPADADLARLYSWTATVHWLLGDLPACTVAADAAMRAAARANEPGALAAAHVARALHAKLAGDPQGNGEHYERALAYAEEARDAVQVTRIRSNRASRLIDDARFAEALAEARPGARLAEEIGHVPMHALALVNEGEALVGLGRLDEALAVFERSVWLYRRTGSRMVAYPLLGVAGIHRRRGRVVQAGAAYEETVEIAEAAGDRQALVPALAGLARLVAARDPQAALGYADRALAAEPTSTVANLALGWARLATGDAEQAAELAGLAAQAARRLQERALLPEALELMGSAATSPAAARRAWREALALWEAAEATLDADRVRAALGVLPGASTDDRIAGKLAAARLALSGVEWTPAGTPPYRLAVRTFGRFEVTSGAGEVVTWQSRKARDLLRILVARRGRPVPREELGEMLWPDENPAKVGHRLSVALSTVRGSLDPEKRMPADHFLLSAQGSVALDTVRIDIDLEDFLLAVEHGLRLHREGRTGQARAVLDDAQRLYTGDFLGDEPYDDWAVPVREEARATYLRVLRALVDLARDGGDTADAVGFLYQILQFDPYDENAHTTLIELLTGHGWHGEAQRAQVRYREAMGELAAARGN
ncbi:BTAD domain-containing putative transcriptional regulator [Micromonospora sp. NPDC049645]|uniref:BTAD domain-containing putative transcriptional regulator n=1 Tax=Micromonospora sp. NPDC049645 TaxID=3155508 RepID=UPI00342A23F4